MPTSIETNIFDAPLAELDPEVSSLIRDEVARQETTLEMIASENFAPRAVLECQGSVLTNKYAEGYPGRRYYGGCEVIDQIESLAIDRAKILFGADHVNVQPHSGAQANAAAFQAAVSPGDTILGLELAHGGHLTHGMRINFSGHFYKAVSYGVERDTSLIDMNRVADAAREHRPKLIVAGWSAYPRFLDFPAFRQIADEIGAVLLVDMAHFAGLVAAGFHPSPVPYADIVTTTVHKTLGGPRSGAILCREEFAKKINSAVFPGQQGGPLEHVIAGKAVAFKIAATAEFRERQRRTVEGAQAIAEQLLQGRSGAKVLTGGTDVHLILADLSELDIDGKQAESRLRSVDIVVNRNAVPFDRRPPSVASGLRIGTSPLATRGVTTEEYERIGGLIDIALTEDFESHADDMKEEVRRIAAAHPLYPWLDELR